jgi:hypothetical protein
MKTPSPTLSALIEQNIRLLAELAVAKQAILKLIRNHDRKYAVKFGKESLDGIEKLTRP